MIIIITLHNEDTHIGMYKYAWTHTRTCTYKEFLINEYFSKLLQRI